MRKYFLPIALLFLAAPLPLLAETHKIPATVDIQVEIRRNQDEMVDEYAGFFRDYADALVQRIRSSNQAKHRAIFPLYRRAFNTGIPASAPDGRNVPADELKNVTDGKLYEEAWLPLILNAPLEKSAYYVKALKPILADPRADRGAVLRIGRDASKEWETYKTYSARVFAGKAAQIKSDFERRLPSLAREHSDLRAALASLAGPIAPDDFDRDFQKYIALAQSKMQPADEPSPSPAPAATPEGQQAPAKVTAAATPAPVEPGTALEARMDDLDAKLKQLKESLDAVKAQAQTLDDNYPILHREMGSQVEKLSAEIFWLRLILVLVGAGVLVGIGISLLALDRIGEPSEKKSRLEKREPRTLREEPLKAILGRIHKMEEEISQLRGELQTDEEFLSGNPKREEDV